MEEKKITDIAEAKAAKKDTPKANKTRKSTGRKSTKTEAAKIVTVAAEATTEAAPAKDTASKKPAAEKKTETAKKSTTRKSTAAKKPASRKSTSKKAAAAGEMIVQYAGKSLTTEDLIKRAREVWKKEMKRKLQDFGPVQLYVKTEENMVYFVVNGVDEGKFSI